MRDHTERADGRLWQRHDLRCRRRRVPDRFDVVHRRIDRELPERHDVRRDPQFATLGTCVPPADRCDAIVPQMTCSGTDLRTCAAGSVVTTHCGAIDPYCMMQSFGTLCLPNATECSVFAETGDTCSGNAIVACANGHTATIDCTTLGLGFTTCTTAPVVTRDAGTPFNYARCEP